MGKSIRSKGQRKNRAVRREMIHKPKEEARLMRLVEKETVETKEQEKPVGVDSEQMETEPKILSKKQKEMLLMSRNQYKRKAKSKKGKLYINKKK
ncbi:hypothetical protein HDV06_004528 [Boothiomyces sp. JEL0866]|nr:hypothetical protein HDV06_004528 [Boothiomyces sp. JEL0866]